jgi:hypothetical protein
MTELTEETHEPSSAATTAIDFFNMPPTNEQIIIATLERIEKLLINRFAGALGTQAPKPPEPAEERKGKIDALMSRTGTRRK